MLASTLRVFANREHSFNAGSSEQALSMREEMQRLAIAREAASALRARMPALRVAAPVARWAQGPRLPLARAAPGDSSRSARSFVPVPKPVRASTRERQPARVDSWRQDRVQASGHTCLADKRRAGAELRNQADKEPAFAREAVRVDLP